MVMMLMRGLITNILVEYTRNGGKQAEKLPLTHWRIEKPDSDDEEVSDGSDTDSWHRHQISALISFFSYLQQTHFLFTSYNMDNMK